MVYIPRKKRNFKFIKTKLFLNDFFIHEYTNNIKTKRLVLVTFI